MKTRINLDRIEEFVCLEPEVGEQLLPLYPEFLSEEEKKQFELHREGCENCQERWKLWQVTGLALRIEAILQQAKTLLENHQYEEAIRKSLLSNLCCVVPWPPLLRGREDSLLCGVCLPPPAA